MTKKTKFEKKETAVTKATFTLDEVRAFALTGYAAQRRDLYLQKVAERPQNPRMVNGLEVLSPVSMVAEIDMKPLSTRQNMARFSNFPRDLENGGFDDDQSYDAPDRLDNPPSPHELRAQNLERKIAKAKKAYESAAEKRIEGGDTPTPNGDPNPAKTSPAPNAPTSEKRRTSLPETDAE